MNMMKRSQLWAVAILVVATVSQAQNFQSPVDFNPPVLRKDPNLPQLKVILTNSTLLQVKNTWNPADTSVDGAPLPQQLCSVKAYMTDTNAGVATLDRNTYALQEFHFHWPSEHTVCGYHARMEVHFVFADRSKIQGEPNSLLVVGAWIEEGERDNPEFAKIFSDLPPAATTRWVTNFNLTRVFPQTRTTFRYPGSLTAPALLPTNTPSLKQQIDSDIYPACVSWLVSDQPLRLSDSQIEAFAALFPGGNARHTFPLPKRTVRTDVKRHDHGDGDDDPRD
jgi:carbonic anhydrase